MGIQRRGVEQPLHAPPSSFHTEWLLASVTASIPASVKPSSIAGLETKETEWGSAGCGNDSERFPSRLPQSSQAIAAGGDPLKWPCEIAVFEHVQVDIATWHDVADDADPNRRLPSRIASSGSSSPTLSDCTKSDHLRWNERHGARVSPKLRRQRLVAREGAFGSHAASRFICKSQWMHRQRDR